MTSCSSSFLSDCRGEKRIERMSRILGEENTVARRVPSGIIYGQLCFNIVAELNLYRAVSHFFTIPLEISTLFDLLPKFLDVNLSVIKGFLPFLSPLDQFTSTIYTSVEGTKD